MNDPYYFAYGSNLNLCDFERYCRERGFGIDLMTPVGTAMLDDHVLEFSHYSKARGGGALNLTKRNGSAVDGVLFRVPTSDGWSALDRKEGAPHRYERTYVEINLSDGQRVRAVTYIVHRPLKPFFAPTDDYVSVVAAGLKQFGLCRRPLYEAASRNDLSCVDDGAIEDNDCHRSCRQLSVSSQPGPSKGGSARGQA